MQQRCRPGLQISIFGEIVNNNKLSQHAIKACAEEIGLVSTLHNGMCAWCSMHVVVVM
jgi:hypothetical protein